jgi:hypothetical protein
VVDWGGDSGAKNGDPLRLARFATFGLILELFVVKKQLLPGSKDEIGAAIDTLQNLVLKLHGDAPFGPCPQRALRKNKVSWRECGAGHITPLCVIPGFGPPCTGGHMDYCKTATCYKARGREPEM